MTILNQYEILESTTPIWWGIGIAVFTIIIVGIIFFIPTSMNDVLHILCWILVAVIFLCIIWVSVVYKIAHREDVPTGRYQYECTIDDGASFTDIMNNYIVVEQRGDIWVLEDK